MKCAAIISEYNPFHNGHKYQIDLLRKQGFDVIVAIMSGSVVQRGETALVDKFTRARAAVLCGVDVVVELPAPFSCTSGEYFARAGVVAADALGADTLSFGSECGDIAALSAHAQKGRTAQPCEGAARAELSGTSFSSNDILAIEYLRAISAVGSDMLPLTHKRIGGAYNSDADNGELSSATAIRRLISEGKFELALPMMPQKAAEALKDGLSAVCSNTLSDEIYSALLLTSLRTSDVDELSSYAFMNGGLASRMKKAAERARCADELYALAATKVYTNSRIRRAALCTVCRIPDIVRRSSPEYLSLLCANGKGREFLSRRSSAIPVLTTVREKKAYASFEYEVRLDSLFETVRKFDGGKRLYTFPPIML